MLASRTRSTLSLRPIIQSKRLLCLTMAPKRKALASPPEGNEPSTKEPKFDHSRLAEDIGIVNRKYYPPEMSNERCEQYNRNELPRPLAVLEQTLKETAVARSKIAVGESVVHWFKRDLRTEDNRALKAASDKAKGNGVPLICLFVVSPQDYEAHLTSPARVDFDLRTLKVLQEDLEQLDIPLHMEMIMPRKRVPEKILELCKQWGANHIFCNIEYEVDELRRETKLLQNALKEGIDFTAIHDDVVVQPGALMTGAGRQYAVYSPWFRSWIAHIHKHPDLLETLPPPHKNPPAVHKKFEKLFKEQVPPTPDNKKMTTEEEDRLASIWPAGEHEATDRLEKFLKSKITKYKDTRNFPAANSTAVLSVHFAAGTLSARTAVKRARDTNSTKKLDGGSAGITGWISEVAWRDFYKHVLAHWPFVCMNKPFKFEYSDIEWEYNMEHFDKWVKGETGFPIIDAAMRQMQEMRYVHNRCRMIVASFLAKDLLLDWRMGERHFMSTLIDGDFASNNGGWGFSASTGVDPQPYFRIFNPLLQSEKFDADGEYIRKWVPELRGVKGKAIHDPYGRGAEKEAAKAGYPKPMVDHQVCRQRALERYKRGLGRNTATSDPLGDTNRR